MAWRRIIIWTWRRLGHIAYASAVPPYPSRPCPNPSRYNVCCAPLPEQAMPPSKQAQCLLYPLTGAGHAPIQAGTMSAVSPYPSRPCPYPSRYNVCCTPLPEQAMPPSKQVQCLLYPLTWAGHAPIQAGTMSAVPPYRSRPCPNPSRYNVCCTPLPEQAMPPSKQVQCLLYPLTRAGHAPIQAGTMSAVPPYLSRPCPHPSRYNVCCTPLPEQAMPPSKQVQCLLYPLTGAGHAPIQAGTMSAVPPYPSRPCPHPSRYNVCCTPLPEQAMPPSKQVQCPHPSPVLSPSW